MSGLPSDHGLPPELAKHTRSPDKVVVYSPSLGVYLGHGKWSFKDPHHTAFASVFRARRPAHECTTDVLREWIGDVPPADARVVEVFPRSEVIATRDECMNVGLPAWG